MGLVRNALKSFWPLLSWVLQNACKSFNFQPFSNLTCPMGDIGNITKDVCQVKKLDFNGVSKDKLNTKSSSIGDRLSSWGQAALKFLGISRIFWMSRVGCPEAYGHTQKSFFWVRRQSALKLLGISRKFWWGGRLPWNSAMLAVFFPKFYPMSTHFQHFCGCIVWFIQIWRIAPKNRT